MARAITGLGRLSSAVEVDAKARLGRRDARTFATRAEYHLPAAIEALGKVYGAEHNLEELVSRLLGIMLDAASLRSEDLRLLDNRREITPDWFQREDMIGYVCYVDKFSGTIPHLERHLDYLEELRVTYLHLMPLLQPRPAPNDGGYAVMDYRSVDPGSGSMADLEHLSRELRNRGISLCIDLVVNHTAREHAWARAALAGDPQYRDFYLIFPDRSIPDAYERTLVDVFPNFAAGSFSWLPDERAWVWTTFHDYQWDLNYANPDVFAAMLETMLFLTNRGVEVLRLDAVPFLWKRLGTDCQNQPEVHLLLEAFRGLVRIVAPAVAFKAEAIVPHHQLVQYLGEGIPERTECDLAYNNQLMVQLWSSLAARDTALMTHALMSMPAPPRHTSWVTYVRGHDDIGWAVSDRDAGAAGVDGFRHREFLNDYFAGRFPGSFARGGLFQENAATGDARISGTAASLSGLELALELEDGQLVEQAIRRLLLIYSVAFSYGGIPLIYMGDELGLRNDHIYESDPDRTTDNRWMHRPSMDWTAAARRADPETVEHKIFAGFCRIIEARRRLPVLHAEGSVVPLWTDNQSVFAYARSLPRAGSFLGLVNFGDLPETCDAKVLIEAGLSNPFSALVSEGALDLNEPRIRLPPLGFIWLAEPR